MHIISLKMLRDFWHRHPEAEQPLRNWHTVAEYSRFTDFADLQQSFGSADYVPPYTVFDVGGNKIGSLSSFATATARCSCVG
ncbi:MAG: type II toxin-antitoxin system HigB family toxin [Sulfuritalea sp.]|nr:type II toxin-antitoxin system HigB family toxin [Sulfuritalea sp.]